MRIEPGPITAAVERLAAEAGDLLVAGERVDDLLARQLVFEVGSRATGFEVLGATQASRDAVAGGHGVVGLVRKWAAMVDSRDGARLGAAAFTDSPAGMSVVDRLAVMDAGLGVGSMPPGEMREFMPMLNQQLDRLPTGHSVSTANLVEPGEHYSWLVIGPQASNDARYFVGDLPRIDVIWPDRMLEGGRDSQRLQAVAAFNGETLAHEGWHARLSRPFTPREGEQFPYRLDEARTQLATMLSGDDARMTRALGMSDAGIVRAAERGRTVYGAEVAALVRGLDDSGIDKEPARRLEFLERTPLLDLQDLVGRLDDIAPTTPPAA